MPLAGLLAIGVFTAGPFPVSSGSHPFVEVAQAQSRVHAMINRLFGRGLPAGIAKSNGRIEAVQVDVTAKYAGRLSEVSVEEGATVKAGQAVATISGKEYEAQLRGAEAAVQRALHAKTEADAQIAQRQSDLRLAEIELNRTEQLAKNHHATRQLLDQRRATYKAATAAVNAANAQRNQADAAAKAAKADVDRLKAILHDLVLRAPRSGRVQHKLMRAGEVVAPGTRVLTILDLGDVYMTIFLPAAEAGRLAVGDQARIVLDPLPQYVVPATVSFVAAGAQFTPKTVETREEREKLMFRVKLQIDPDVLEQYESRVKAGVRGLGFVRLGPSVQWPDNLQVKLPQ
ncbi:MAG: HlyD family efflux transporter periplasmic adaptor subunit [Alphaproteobacteria bacterium]|nr:HlyD family efflux transporter periplasmic adaptor subunit [Alphaproteobacteria bacterium]